jgi:hypothetical protein
MMKVQNKLEILDPLIIKISELPESIQLQVSDYIEYLYSKYKPRIKDVEVKLSEEEKVELLRKVVIKLGNYNKIGRMRTSLSSCVISDSLINVINIIFRLN